MTGVETIVLKTAEGASIYLLKKVFKSLIADNSNGYAKELTNAILMSIQLYETNFPVEETDKIPFYKSQHLLNEFLEFRFTKKIDKQRIKKIIDADKRIISPTELQLNNFFNIFYDIVSGNSKLKLLNIEINFKEEIFNISEFLNSLNEKVEASLKEIKEILLDKALSIDLIEDWNKQLDEIFNDIKCFKSFTAKQRLENLEIRINNQSLNSDKLLARLYFLKSECLNQINAFETTEEHSKLFIKCYNLQPNNFDYRIQAMLGYYSLKEFSKAQEFCDDVLRMDEFNIFGWLIRCYLANQDFETVLRKITPLVKSKNLFKINLYYFLISNKYVQTYEDIKRLDLLLNIDFLIKIEVSYKNIKYQLLISNYLLANFFEENKAVPLELKYQSTNDSASFNYAFDILKSTNEILSNSEIESSYHYSQFHFYCCSFIFQPNEKFITPMRAIFDKLKIQSFDVTIRMIQVYNYLRTNEAYFEAIKIGEQYNGEHNDAIQLLIADNYGFLNDKEKQIKSLINFIEVAPKIDRTFLLSLTYFMRTHSISPSEKFIDAVEKTLFKKPVQNREYLILLKVFFCINLRIGAYLDSEIDALIESLKNLVDNKDIDVCTEVAYCYCYNKQEEKAKSYLQLFVDVDHPSESLKLYCKVLFQTNGNKLELLKILNKWRNNWEPDFELLQIEFELRRLENKWDEAVKICKQALRAYPSSEFFINALFISLGNNMQFDDIKKEYDFVKDNSFKQESVAIVIAKALIRAGLLEESLELLYKHAKKKDNIQSRREYAVLFIYYQGLFGNYEEVTTGRYVKYEIDGVQEILQITEPIKDNSTEKLFLNRKINETFKIPKRYSDVFATVKIIHITNKYGALLQELFKEAENPLSGHIIQPVKFKNDSIEALEETLIENFGVRGSLQKQHIQTRLEEYYNGYISFSEVTTSAFNGEFVNAYFILSKQTNKPFKAIAKVLSNNLNLNEETKYVLDFTSVCLFYELSREFKFDFTKKFVVSHLIKDQIVQGLEKAKSDLRSNLSVSITIERITPQFYDDGFNDRTINTFQTLLDWINSNCIIVDVPERLDIIVGSNTKFKDTDLFLDTLIDCRLLIDKPNYILLTNDLVYYKFLKCGSNNVISPLHYLEKYHLDKSNDYIGLMLKNNYIGIPISATILNEQFYKMLSGANDNRFSICLENLRYNWNPDYTHLTEAVKFIKGLYVNSIVNNKLREQTTLSVLQNLTLGMEPRLGSELIRLINIEFKFLDIQKIIVLQLLNLAVTKSK